MAAKTERTRQCDPAVGANGMNADLQTSATPDPKRSPRWRRVLPLAAVVVLMVVVFATGLHRHLSLETLVRYRADLEAFVGANLLAAVLAYVAIYIVTVALSLPGAVFLTIAGGVLFGAIVAGSATVIGATIGATIIFLIAKSAFGEHLVSRAGLLAAKLADGFRAEAFSYLLFLRLVPLFPFWLVNLAPALFGVRLGTFVVATAVGIIPGTFAFAFVGAGLDSVIAAQQKAYMECLASGRADCRLDFDVRAALTPELIAAFVALGVVALVPVVVKRWRARRASDPAV
jgi:uncharacterized membrane protein YdjX (TVP38/TMEM64 family)